MTLEERIKQMLQESMKPETTQETVDEGRSFAGVGGARDREDDEGYSKTSKSDAKYNASLPKAPVRTLKQQLEKEKADKASKIVAKEDTEIESEDLDTIEESKEAVKSEQISALLESEGLSEDFKVQAVTIFEAAVTDRVLQVQEDLEVQFTQKLDEAKADLEVNIDGFLNEAVQTWANDNEVAIQSNFKTRLAESFMDGLRNLLSEHNIDLPTKSEDALDIALERVNTLEEQLHSVNDTVAQLQEQIQDMHAEKILESFKEKMTSTEFDRFAQLAESVKFKDEVQYEKQLNIVLENFGKITSKAVVTQPQKMVTETVASDVQPQITESYSSVNRYAEYLATAKH